MDKKGIFLPIVFDNSKIILSLREDISFLSYLINKIKYGEFYYFNSHDATMNVQTSTTV